MRFADYLRLEGRCAVVLGVALVALAAAFGRWDGPVWSAPAVAVVTSVLAVVAARAATRSAVAKAARSAPHMAAGAVRNQTVAETVVWAVAVGLWLALTGSSAELIAGTGVATAAFGVARLRAQVPPRLVVDRRRFVAGATVADPARA